MRRQFVQTACDLLDENDRVVILLGDFGVYLFRRAFADHPERIINAGISEQAMIGMAAGLAKGGFIPIVYTIAPFLVERAYEQIKIDIGYQGLKVILVTAGASFDYSTMGATHHCPADVALMYNVPRMRILAPGAPEEVDSFLRQAVQDEYPYYMRICNQRNPHSYPELRIGESRLQKKGGNAGTVIACGNSLAEVFKATDDISQVNVLYYPTVRPFDAANLQEHCQGGRILLVEPWYSTLYQDVTEAVNHAAVVHSCSVPREFITHYGTLDDFNRTAGICAYNIRSAVWKLISTNV